MKVHAFAVVWESKDFRQIRSYLKQNMNRVGKDKGEQELPEHTAVPTTLPTPFWATAPGSSTLAMSGHFLTIGQNPNTVYQIYMPW